MLAQDDEMSFLVMADRMMNEPRRRIQLTILRCPGNVVQGCNTSENHNKRQGKGKEGRAAEQMKCTAALTG